MRIFSYSLVLFLASLAQAAPNTALETAQAQQNAAMYNYLAASKLSKSDSKTAKMMMMMQMMQANANMQAAQQNQKNGDKQDKKDKEETKKSEQIAKLEIPEFKAPATPPEEKGPDLSDLTYKPSKEPLPLPPVPVVDPNEAAQIVAGFKPLGTELSPSPSVSPAPSAAPIAEGASKLGKPISLPSPIPLANPDGKVGFDNTINPRGTESGFAGRAIASQPSPSPSAGISAGDEIASFGNGRRKATKDDVDYGGGSGGGDEGKRDSGGFGAMLADLMGFKLPGGDDEIPADIEQPEKESAAGGNIFEYASYRYRKLEIRGKAGHYNDPHLTQK